MTSEERQLELEKLARQFIELNNELTMKVHDLEIELAMTQRERDYYKAKLTERNFELVLGGIKK